MCEPEKMVSQQSDEDQDLLHCPHQLGGYLTPSVLKLEELRRTVTWMNESPQTQYQDGGDGFLMVLLGSGSIK